MTNRTTALRKLVATQLRQIAGGVYHRRASDKASYPYKVFTLERVTLTDLTRCDYDLCIDVWDRGQDPKTAEQIGDRLRDLFNAQQFMQDSISVQTFAEDCYPVEDEDKDLVHYQMHIQVQLYERTE